MPEVAVYESPHEAAQALVADHLMTRYNMPRDRANMLLIAVDLAMTAEDEKVKLGAIQTVLKHTQPEIKAIAVHHSGEVDHKVSAKGREEARKAIDGVFEAIADIKRTAAKPEEEELAPAPVEEAETIN